MSASSVRTCRWSEWNQFCNAVHEHLGQHMNHICFCCSCTFFWLLLFVPQNKFPLLGIIKMPYSFFLPRKWDHLVILPYFPPRVQTWIWSKSPHKSVKLFFTFSHKAFSCFCSRETVLQCNSLSCPSFKLSTSCLFWVFVLDITYCIFIVSAFGIHS